MNQTSLPTLNELLSLPAETTSSPAKSTPLRNIVRESLSQYFAELDNQQPMNLYELVLAEVEAPMLEMVLQYVGQNQSKAARLLKISRGTLRKKMQLYGFLPDVKK